MNQMQEWRRKLEIAGHTCTARWIDGNEEGMTLAAAAQRDLDDIDAVDAVISKILPAGAMFTSGGRHVEFGYAVARNKILIVVGPDAENIFHNLPTVVRVDTIDHALLWLVAADLEDT